MPNQSRRERVPCGERCAYSTFASACIHNYLFFCQFCNLISISSIIVGFVKVRSSKRVPTNSISVSPDPEFFSPDNPSITEEQNGSSTLILPEHRLWFEVLKHRSLQHLCMQHHIFSIAGPRTVRQHHCSVGNKYRHEYEG